MKDDSDDFFSLKEIQALRIKAEKRAAENTSNISVNIKNYTNEEISPIIHELQVHQIELEMQNDELRKTQRALDEERKRYVDLYDLAPVGYCTLSEEGIILEANLAAATLLGISRKELLNKPLYRFVFIEDKDSYYLFQKHSQQNTMHSCELRLLRDNKTPFWTQLSATKSKNDPGIGTTRIVLNDITERRVADEEQQIAAIAFESQSGMMITDAKGVILRVNPAFTRLTGYSAEESIGQTPKFLKSGRQDHIFYQQMWKTIQENKRWEGEIWNKRKNGNLYAERLIITAVVAKDGSVTHYVGNFTDITEDKEAAAAIHRLAYYDALTHLPNRRLFQKRLIRAITATARSQSFGAIFFIDLDKFKELNDTRGHDVGDLLLIEVAERLQTVIRDEDTVARQGGDEFIILLENLKKNVEEAAYLAKQIGDKLFDVMRKPFILNEYEYYCRLSIGIGLFNQADSAEDLFKHADIALYQAKKTGGNRLLFFDPVMQTVLDLRTALERELKQALFDNQFRLYYQPQVDNLHRVTGVEALLRWQHPTRGLILPNDFIPLAEDTGLIIPLGLWVLQHACAQLKAWEAKEYTRDLTMAINVSTRQFRQSDFVELVEKTIQTSGVNPERLKLELTESLVLENIHDSIEKMVAIKRLGVHFSMDDFGTGYSSLSYLAQLPLDQLKIDQSFVRNLPESNNDAMIAQTIIRMGLGLSLNVIAEGVETAEQFTFLESHGCHAFQGYLFSHPVDIETLTTFLEGQRDRGTCIGCKDS